MNRSTILSLAIYAAAFVPVAAMAAPTDTASDFAFRHPARSQVIYRIERIKWIVDARERAGDFTEKQAVALRAQADGIQGEEQYLATLHGGRLTGAEQTKLNRDLDGLFRQLNS